MKKHLEGKNIIAVCCATLRELSVLEPTDAICKKANELGYYVKIFQAFEEIDGVEDVYAGEESVFDLINYDELAGLIVFGERIKDHDLIRSIVDSARAKDVPVVSIDRTEKDCFSVTFDYKDAFEQLVRHVVEYHGKNDIFVMAGMPNNSFTSERLDVVRRVLAESNRILPEENIAYGMFWEFPTKDAMEAFFASGRKLPEAFIAMNDTMATVIIDELQKHGYRVPEDVLVTGFDGIFLSEYCIPRITTAKQQLVVAGERAVETICEYAKEQNTEIYDISVPFKVIIRQSCGCQAVNMNGVTANLRDLYSNFESSKRVANYMDEMSRRMTSTTNVRGFAQEAGGYANFLDSHNRIFICINKEYLKFDERFYSEEIQKFPYLKDSEKDMVVVTDAGNGSDGSYIMKDFKKLEIMPDIDKYLAEVKNIIIAPIHQGREIYGHLVADYKPGDRNGYKTKMYVNKLSNMLYLIKQKNLLYNINHELMMTKNKLEDMYVTDLMTGIFNRRGFYQKYDEIKAKKPSGMYTIISADLDDLKMINDTYGHQEGDFAIKSIGEALASVVGDRGIFARFGGDEFMAMITDTPADEHISEKIYDGLAQYIAGREDITAKPYNVRFSMGAVQASWSDNTDLESIINKSDKLLYEMKKKHHEGIYDRRRR